MTTTFAILLSYCLAERLFEVFLSARNRRQMRSRHYLQHEAKAPLRTMVALHTAWIISLVGEATLAPTELPPLLVWLAAIAFIAAQALRAWTLRSLGAHWNISVMTSPTDAPSFVSHGPYRYIRHPNYLVVIVELATLPLVGGALITSLVFSLLNALVIRERIDTEERALFSIPGYAATMGSKPRLFPW